MPRWLKFAFGVLLVVPLGASAVGILIGGGILHPMNLNPNRLDEARQMLARTGATKEDFVVRAPDGVELRGWKIHPASHRVAGYVLTNPERTGDDWVLLFHGVSDNRTGDLGYSEFLLRNGYSLVMMDSRAHGQSGGAMATYGWLERYDTVAVTNELFAGEYVRHLYALGVSMGASIALQSASLEPRIKAVVAEDPFSDLREVSYDYAGLRLSPLLGKTLFRPAVYFAMRAVQKEGGFSPDDVSPENAVAARPFPVLLICGTRDRTIPCRHAERIYAAARGPKQLWIVPGADHASAFGHSPAAYERRVIAFFEEAGKSSDGNSEVRQRCCGIPGA